MAEHGNGNGNERHYPELRTAFVEIQEYYGTDNQNYQVDPHDDARKFLEYSGDM